MLNKILNLFLALPILLLAACSFESEAKDSYPTNVFDLTRDLQEPEPHKYGGWYCPDNMTGFPPVNIADWQNVPTIKGRLATKEETQSEAALIFVDTNKYPNAKPIDMNLPRLAKYHNYGSNRVDLVIVIEALSIQKDSIAGFRYLNGGNGSARLDKIKFLTDSEITKIPNSKFVSQSIEINASQDKVAEVMRNPSYQKQFQSTFDTDMSLHQSWRKKTNLNYFYPNAGLKLAAYADILFGNFYVQNDFDRQNYTEKFLLTTNQETKKTTLQIVCGPFVDDYQAQNIILKNWADKVKEIAEGDD